MAALSASDRLMFVAVVHLSLLPLSNLPLRGYHTQSVRVQLLSWKLFFMSVHFGLGTLIYAS